MNGIPSDFGYQTGSYVPWGVPPFMADSVVIRPFGEYALDPVNGYATTLGGGFGVNYQSSGAVNTPDLTFLWQNELQAVPNLKQILLAIYWYTPPGSNLVLPAVGPEVQANTWSGAAPPSFAAGSFNRTTAYQLQATHQVWPSQNDASLVAGIRWLQSKGYQVGLIPINVFLSNDLYFTGGGEWEMDRTARSWLAANLAAYLNSYETFIKQYVDLCARNDLALSIFSIGYGLRDLTGIADRTQIPSIIGTLQILLSYCKTKLLSTKTTYLADLDEYYYPFLVSTTIDGALDALWTYPDLDFIGINWFAPLALDNSEDTDALMQNVVRGEGYSYQLANFKWRNDLTDRLLSITTNDFKTSLSQATIDPRIYAVKNIEDWLVFSHYIPATVDLAGCTPPAGVIDPARKCGNIQGVAKMISLLAPLAPTIGGIFKPPPRKNVYLQLDSSSSCAFIFPATIPDSSILDFEFDYILAPGQAGNIFQTSFGLALNYVDNSAILQLGTLAVPLFTAWKGKLRLVYQPTSVDIYVNGAFVNTIPGTFQMPAPGGSLSFGAWQGKLFYIRFILGTGNNLSGGEFYFEDAYAGVRTAWKSGLKQWIALTGYGSMEGTGADPFTRPETILWSGAASVPLTYPNEATLNAAVFRNNYHIKDIQIPYGSPADIDQVYQSIVFYCAFAGLMPAGPQHIFAWFFDTRAYAAMTNMMSDGSSQQIFNDAFDADINASLNGKPIIHQATGQLIVYAPDTTIDNMLELSQVPGALPRVRAVLVEQNVPQGSPLNP